MEKNRKKKVLVSLLILTAPPRITRSKHSVGFLARPIPPSSPPPLPLSVRGKSCGRAPSAGQVAGRCIRKVNKGPNSVPAPGTASSRPGELFPSFSCPFCFVFGFFLLGKGSQIPGRRHGGASSSQSPEPGAGGRRAPAGGGRGRCRPRGQHRRPRSEPRRGRLREKTPGEPAPSSGSRERARPGGEPLPQPPVPCGPPARGRAEPGGGSAASRCLPGLSRRAFPSRSPPSEASLAHIYRVNISPSFQPLGPRETDSHLAPPLPAAPPPAADRCCPPRSLLLPLGNTGGLSAPAKLSAAPLPFPPCPGFPISRPPGAPPAARGRWGDTCSPSPRRRAGQTRLLLLLLPPFRRFFALFCPASRTERLGRAGSRRCFCYQGTPSPHGDPFPTRGPLPHAGTPLLLPDIHFFFRAV